MQLALLSCWAPVKSLAVNCVLADVPCNETITAEGVVNLIIKHVFPHYGFPRRIISDQDTRFMSLFMKHFYQKTGTKQNVSMAYHLQTDGQSERMNQWLEQYL